MNPETIVDYVNTAFKENPPAQDIIETISFCQVLTQRKINTVLEIGCHKLGGLNVWGKFADKNALLVGIELENLPKQKCGEPDQSVRIIRGDSHNPEIFREALQVLNGRKLGFLFIDGDHTCEGCKSDFLDYSELVEEGGLVAIHDCESEPGVKQFIGELINYFPLYEVKPSIWNPFSLKYTDMNRSKLNSMKGKR